MKYILYIIASLLLNTSVFGQETLPVYTDYLTDNIFLIHPAGAGVSDYGKIRLTGRKQWINYDKAPELQTLSFHTHLGSKSAVGAVFYNDKNGHFSQVGGQLTYAYHISFDRYNSNQFSFALSLLTIRNTLDGSDYDLIDSDVDQAIISKNYFNADVGFAYRSDGFFSFYTIKNLLLTQRSLFNQDYESNNLKRHLVTLGYLFNHDERLSIKFQPSVMGQIVAQTQEILIDANLKSIVPLEKGEIYAGLSYRMGFNNTLENANYFTPFLGIKHKDFVVSYSYTHQQNNELFTKGAFHQITLGYNFYLDRYTRTATWDL